MNKRLTYIIFTSALLLAGLAAKAQVTVGGSVYGGGSEALVCGSCSVLIDQDGARITNNVFGGGALAMVNTTDSTTCTPNAKTTVTLTQGTVVGSIYGGGLGQITPTPVAADVFGPDTVWVNGGSVTNVFGCNDLNGTPKSTVVVIINGSEPTVTDEGGVKTYAINGVYGGGNEADYDPTTPGEYPKVFINNCATSIENVYGGGNAAAVPYTSVTVNGGDIGRVFGGGNGERGVSYPAHVGRYTASDVTYGTGNTNIAIHGGTIGQVFGGSNANGQIKGAISVSVAKSGSCAIALGELYGGGNLAPSQAGSITIGCMEATDMIDYVYGGANQANITGNIALTMTGGRVGNLFGGNNTSGTISGTITVNVNWDGSCSNNYLGNVYGAGNLATFGTTESPKAPTVNILNGTVSGNVYGGGKGVLVDGENHGNAGKVTGNPQVNIGDDNGSHTAIVEGDVYGGGDAATVAGTPVIVVNDCNTEIGYLYGGGNAADVNGTNITFNAGTVHYSAFGGGHGDKNASDPEKYADVNGNVLFNVYGGTIDQVFAGSNSKGDITGTVALNINKTGTCAMKIREVYGGGNEAAGNAGAITIGCTGAILSGVDGHAAHPENIGTSLEGIGYVYGGANQADIGTSSSNSNITLDINSGIVANVFGGNNTSGTIYGTITVDINKTSESNTCGWYVGNVFGGGNLAPYTGSPTVNILNGTVSGNVYGGGKGQPADHTKGQVTGNPVVTIGDNTVGHESYVAAVAGSVFGGGDAGNVVGTPVVNVVEKCNTTITTAVYGGGNAADVSATNVTINGGTIGDVFGGGNGAVAAANVTGATRLVIHGGTISRVFSGGNTSGTIGTNSGVTIDHTSSCNQSISEVYGGGNLAAGNAGTISIGCTAVNIGDVYGGANNASINNNILLNITGGQINNVYGGNNTDGTIYGTITVNVNKASDCNTFSLGNVFGGGNHAAYSGTPAVNIQNGTVSGCVYGGGNEAGVGGGNVAMSGGTVLGGLYGGCNTSGNVGGDITVNITGGTIGSSSNLAGPSYITADVFGGGFGASTSTSGDVTVNINGASVNIYGDVYGGSALGSVNSSTASPPDTTTVNILNGTLHSEIDDSGDFPVYHGGNVYGGGLGKADYDTCGRVNGEVIVNIGTGTIAETDPYTSAVAGITGNATIEGSVYGCNNTNGSPQQNVTVNVFQTNHESGVNGYSDPGYAIANVFGGGNEADFTASEKTATVNIWGCENTIERTFGGGNAAATPSVVTNIQGGHISQVFGGGNGERGDQYGADVNGTVSLNMHGGHIGQSFGGSNQNGTITGQIIIVADDNGPCGSMIVDEFFCGSNFVDITSDLTTDITCSDGMVVRDLYGGCNQADITGDVTLNLYGGEYTNVFGGSKGIVGTPANISGDVTLNLYGGTMENVYGGSNINGNIEGIITVNVLDVEGECPLNITNIYGGSNLTSYTPNEISSGVTPISPIVNVVHAKNGIRGNVYGGSKGAVGGSTSVTANPLVNIGYNADMKGYIIPTSDYLTDYSALLDAPRAIISGSVYGGGDAATVSGNTAIFLRNRAKVFGNVYGGGNMGEVTGDTKVIVNGANE